MRHIGIYPNLKKRNVEHVTKDAIKWLENKGKEIYIPEKTFKHLGVTNLKPLEKAFDQLDMVISLGGDGTLLRVARKIAYKEIPILGVNFGHLGFLTELEIPELFKGFMEVFRNNYYIENRMMLKSWIETPGFEGRNYYALNDIVVTKGSFARLIMLETYVNNEFVETYPADGLIISTPTGSTAYSLAAGGPIVNPNLDLLLITPICPHSLYARSLVVSGSDKVKVKILADHKDIMLTVDGQQGFKLKPGDEVNIVRANFNTKLIRLKERNFYEILREKLKERA
ncbi:MAG TPA: NAD(+)/NADH kinase [Thermoanaerobacterales bacterium]|nr:NAD(+)/NADH kinase [Thermoanaerobacterales bacterium]